MQSDANQSTQPAPTGAPPEQPSTSSVQFPPCMHRVFRFMESVATSQTVSKTKLKARIHKKKTELDKLKTNRRKIKQRIRDQTMLLSSNEMEIDEVKKDLRELEATLVQVGGGYDSSDE